MDAEDKATAERVLRRLCIGAVIDGVRFGEHFIYQLLIRQTNDERQLIRLNFENEWFVFAELPDKFTDSRDDMDELSIEEQMRLLLDLRARRQIRRHHSPPHNDFRIRQSFVCKWSL
jgi:hypothetical protein